MAQQHVRGSKALQSDRFTPQGNSRRQKLALAEAEDKKKKKNGGKDAKKK